MNCWLNWIQGKSGLSFDNDVIRCRFIAKRAEPLLSILKRESKSRCWAIYHLRRRFCSIFTNDDDDDCLRLLWCGTLQNFRSHASSKSAHPRPEQQTFDFVWCCFVVFDGEETENDCYANLLFVCSISSSAICLQNIITTIGKNIERDEWEKKSWFMIQKWKRRANCIIMSETKR